MKLYKYGSYGLLLLGLLLPSGGMLNAETGPQPQADFNHDFVADLAIGAHRETLGSTNYEAGAVHALYGQRGIGITSTGSQFWTQDVNNTVGTAEPYDHFGQALAVGDFDCIGGLDLVVGVPGQSVNGYANAGAIHVFYGFSSGLGTSFDEIFHQDTGIIGSNAEENDRFGWPLAAGDFNGDGCDDLAIGVPYEDWNVEQAGIVQILYGSPFGLRDTGTQLWRQGAGGLPDGEEIGDHFGKALTTGDFNGDGYADLAIGAPDEDFASPLRYDTGVVHILYGSASGLTTTGNQYWHQDNGGLIGSAEAYDNFGQSLATGDFNRDGYADLAIGVPGQNVGGDANAGAVHILYGGSSGLIATGDMVFNQDILGTGAQANDHFGFSLASSDFNGDGYADLAIGVPDEDFGLDNIGCVQIIYGTPAGLVTSGSQVWFQGILGVADEAEANDRFGYSLAAGDFNSDGYGDLVIGVPYEDVMFNSVNQTDAGAIHILYGRATGLSSAGNTFWTQASSGITGDPEANDFFGFALAADPRVFHHVYLPLVLRN